MTKLQTTLRRYWQFPFRRTAQDEEIERLKQQVEDLQQQVDGQAALIGQTQKQETK